LKLLSATFIFGWKNIHEPKQNWPVVPREIKQARQNHVKQTQAWLEEDKFLCPDSFRLHLKTRFREKITRKLLEMLLVQSKDPAYRSSPIYC
jgi:hypothetical protein